MPPTATRVAAGHPRRYVHRTITVAIAAAVTGMAWLAGRIAHVNYVVETPFGTREIGLLLTVAATAGAGMAGWALLAVLERYTTSARRTWIALAVVGLIVSILPIFATAAAVATQLTLSVLHCIAAAILIPGLPQTR